MSERTLPELITALRERYPEDFFLSGCLGLPMEPGDADFSPARKPYANCGCGDCQAGHLAGVLERAAPAVAAGVGRLCGIDWRRIVRGGCASSIALAARVRCGCSSGYAVAHWVPWWGRLAPWCFGQTGVGSVVR